VLSQRVAQRTQEIGIRVALGARQDDILKLIVGEGLRLTLIGIAIGIARSLALGRFLASTLYAVTPTDPLTFAAISCLLLLVALLACYLPARRAVRLDPLTALRLCAANRTRSTGPPPCLMSASMSALFSRTEN
jgi:putative ABC transport system permease protein